MADAFTAKFDVSEIVKFFDKLPTKGESLARRMAVSGGRVLRDEAQVRALESHAKQAWPYNPISRGSHAAGTLSEAIKLTRNDKLTSGSTYTYSVSWVNALAWWGKLREFGWTQTNVIRYVEKGDYFITTKHLLPEPIRHGAKPVLAPTYDAKLAEAKEAMIARGRVELPILLGEPE